MTLYSLVFFAILSALIHELETQADKYHVVLQLLEYSSAQTYCKTEYDTDLASIHSEDDNNAVKELCRAAGNGDDVDCWIGLNDIAQEGIFEWEDGTVFDYGSDVSGGVDPWSTIGSAGPQPNNWENEDCIELRARYEFNWNDGGCTKTGYFICNAYSHTVTVTIRTDSLSTILVSLVVCVCCVAAVGLVYVRRQRNKNGVMNVPPVQPAAAAATPPSANIAGVSAPGITRVMSYSTSRKQGEEDVELEMASGEEAKEEPFVPLQTSLVTATAGIDQGVAAEEKPGNEGDRTPGDTIGATVGIDPNLGVYELNNADVANMQTVHAAQKDDDDSAQEEEEEKQCDQNDDDDDKVVVIRIQRQAEQDNDGSDSEQLYGGGAPATMGDAVIDDSEGDDEDMYVAQPPKTTTTTAGTTQTPSKQVRKNVGTKTSPRGSQHRVAPPPPPEQPPKSTPFLF